MNTSLVDDKEFAFRNLVEDRKKVEGEKKELFQEARIWARR